MKTFSVGAIYKEATAVMKQDRWGKIWQFMLISIVFSLCGYVLLGRGGVIGGIIISFIITVWSLSFATKGSFTYNDIFENRSMRDFAYFTFAMLLAMLCIVGGTILLIIPGIMLAVRYAFVQYVAVEEKLPPTLALKRSAHITKGVRWKIFWFMIVSLLINLLGLICLIVGVFYTIPLTSIARAMLYKKLSEQSA